MLSSVLNGSLITALRATDKDADYRCPECNAPVILRKGKYRVAHFAHKIDEGCRYGEGMTEDHLLAQTQIFDVLDSNGFYCELESRRFRGRRADVYTEINDEKVVFEVQHSQITPEEILSRNQFYSDNGCYVIWVLTPGLFGKLRARCNPSKGIPLANWQIRINDIYGCVFIWWDSKLIAYQFDPAIRDSEFNRLTQEFEYVGKYQLKKTFDKIGYAEIDLIWGIKNRILIPFKDETFNTSCFGLSPENYAADWKFPDKCYRWSDPLSVAV